MINFGQWNILHEKGKTGEHYNIRVSFLRKVKVKSRRAYGSSGSITLSTASLTLITKISDHFIYRVKSEELPIPKGGLEIIPSVTFKIEDSKKRYLERLINLIGENYETSFETTNNSAVSFDDEQDTDNSDDFDINDKDVMFFIDDDDEKQEEERSEG